MPSAAELPTTLSTAVVEVVEGLLSNYSAPTCCSPPAVVVVVVAKVAREETLQPPPLEFQAASETRAEAVVMGAKAVMCDGPVEERVFLVTAVVT